MPIQGAHACGLCRCRLSQCIAPCSGLAKPHNKLFLPQKCRFQDLPAPDNNSISVLSLHAGGCRTSPGGEGTHCPMARALQPHLSLGTHTVGAVREQTVPPPPSLAKQIPASPLPKHHFFPSILCPLFVSQWDIWGQSSLAAPICSSPHVAPTPSAHWDAAGPHSSVTSWGSPITPHPPCCLSLHFSQLWHPPSAP